jgi:hypothetical protein
MFEVAVARRCQKRAHQLTLPRYIGRWGGGAAHGAPSATRELASRCRRAIKNRRDFLERQIKHIMQYEGESLSGSQLVENEQKRWADRISKHEVRVGIAVAGRVGRGHEWLLTPRPPRAQDVETYACYNGRQPTAEVLYLYSIRAADFKPSLLDGILGLADRAQHSVRDRSEAGATFIEPLG